jgi:hypothetical protein
LGFHLLDDSSKPINVVANIEHDCFLPVSYLFEAARLPRLANRLAQLAVVSNLLVLTDGLQDLVGYGVVLLDE